jgi:hypothetical protein
MTHCAAVLYGQHPAHLLPPLLPAVRCQWPGRLAAPAALLQGVPSPLESQAASGHQCTYKRCSQTYMFAFVYKTDLATSKRSAWNSASQQKLWYNLVAALAAGECPFVDTNSLWLSALNLLGNATLVVRERVYVSQPPLPSHRQGNNCTACCVQ